MRVSAMKTPADLSVLMKRTEGNGYKVRLLPILYFQGDDDIFDEKKHDK